MTHWASVTQERFAANFCVFKTSATCDAKQETSNFAASLSYMEIQQEVDLYVFSCSAKISLEDDQHREHPECLLAANFGVKKVEKHQKLILAFLHQAKYVFVLLRDLPSLLFPTLDNINTDKHHWVN